MRSPATLALLATTLNSCLLATALLSTAQAALEPPEGETVLVIQGMIGQRNCSQGLCLDLAMLKALPQHTVVITHPSGEGQHAYVGPLLRDVLILAQASGDQLSLRSPNDQELQFVFGDVATIGPVLAWQEDGLPMHTRDKGPLWLILPLDEHPAMTQMKYLSTVVWQLAMIDVGL